MRTIPRDGVALGRERRSGVGLPAPSAADPATVGGFATSGALGMLGARGMLTELDDGLDEDEVGGLLGRSGGGFDSREVGRPCSIHTTPPSASNRSITASTCASVAPVESATSSTNIIDFCNHSKTHTVAGV